MGCFFKKCLTANWLLLSLSVASFICGMIFSIWCRNFEWLGRFGALIICWGILHLARPSITGNEIGSTVYDGETDISLDDPEYFKQRLEAVPDWAVDKAKSRAGPITCFVGTFTNGFSSLLNGPFGFIPGV